MDDEQKIALELFKGVWTNPGAEKITKENEWRWYTFGRD